MSDVQRIISDLEQQRDAIDRALEALRQITGTGGTRTRGSQTARQTGSAGITPEGKQRLADAMRRRWAAKRAAQKSAGASKRAKSGSGARNRSRGTKAGAKKRAGTAARKS